jgi:hypothetical protein
VPLRVVPKDQPLALEHLAKTVMDTLC